MPQTSFEIAAEFRLCRQEDLPALEWMGLHGRDREVIAAAFAAQQQDRGAMLLALADGFPIGQAWIDFAERGSPVRPVIWAVRVFPPLRGAGLGAALMGAAERLASGRGARELELSVERHNDAARRFYRRLGYRPAGTRQERVRHGSDMPEEVLELEIMRKPLPAAAAGVIPEG